MTIAHFVAWDIGGAHLKVASVSENGSIEFVQQYATPLWQGLSVLTEALAKAVADLPSGTVAHTVTMTAELTDIFKGRQQGVTEIVKLCESTLGPNTQFYSIAKGALARADVPGNELSIASANWHATAAYAALTIDSGLLIDIGSTTTDIIPFSEQRVLNRGGDDNTRLHYDELVYTGVIRTPLMSLTQQVPFNGNWQSLAAEHFATTADVYRLLKQLTPGDDMLATADGDNKDLTSSAKRLARMLGSDADKASLADWQRLAAYFAEVQLQLLTGKVLRVLSAQKDITTVIAAGVGQFLVMQLAARVGLACQPFSDLLAPPPPLQHPCNQCAPAVALAALSHTWGLT